MDEKGAGDREFHEEVNATVKEIMIRRWTDSLPPIEDIQGAEVYKELDKVRGFAIKLHRYLQRK